MANGGKFTHFSVQFNWFQQILHSFDFCKNVGWSTHAFMAEN